MGLLSVRAGHSRSPPRGRLIDAAEVSAELHVRMRELATVLLGGRNLALSSATEWRWRRKGSFSLCVAGPHAGRWFDHEAGVGGDGLALIRRQRACSFAQAVAWAAAWIGGKTKPPALQLVAAPVSKT